MPMADVFNQDAFKLVSMTKAINHLPYQQGRLGAMGLFQGEGITTTTAVIEENRGALALLPSTTRGGPAHQATHDKRKVRSFIIPHIPYEDTLKATDVQDVRELGSDSNLQTVSRVVNQRLQRMRQHHEVTEEWLRIGAIKGVIVDGDGSTTLYNLFTEFGITEPTPVPFDLDNANAKIGQLLTTGVVHVIEDALGHQNYDHIHALCSRQWFAKFIDHDEVKFAYQYYQESRALREDMRAGFPYKNVIFEEYHGKVDDQLFIPNGDVRFFPVGVPDLFLTHYAPADFMETANTIGLPVYAKQEQRKFARGIDIHTQSNPLPLCTKPGVLVRGHDGAS